MVFGTKPEEIYSFDQYFSTLDADLWRVHRFESPEDFRFVAIDCWNCSRLAFYTVYFSSYENWFETSQGEILQNVELYRICDKIWVASRKAAGSRFRTATYDTTQKLIECDPAYKFLTTFERSCRSKSQATIRRGVVLKPEEQHLLKGYVRDPNGKIHAVFSITEFAAEHDLSPGGLSSLLAGRAGQTGDIHQRSGFVVKGWRLAQEHELPPSG
ncbi:MAG: hypothetical protein KME10_24890 [Plectolyngbya sp. WJT66-NPBG17]|nr:hypothetical protein [Plectolyngbya sp. WJT66-NPBG17]